MMIEPVRTTEYWLTEPRKFERRTSQIDELPPGHCLVKTGPVGICSGDEKYFAGKKDPEKLKKRLPLIQGHEGEASVLICEDGSLSPGTMVAVIPFQPCGQCPQCRSGRENYCRGRKMMGSNAPGLARTHFIYPSQFLRPAPPGVSPFMAALAEPASVALHAIRGAKGNERIAVFGTGPIGYLVAANLAHFQDVPPERLYFFGRRVSKLQLGEDFTTPVKIEDESIASYKEGFDLVFEAVGAEESVQCTLDLTKKGGTCVVIGISDTPITLTSGSETKTIPSLTEFVNGGGRLEIDGKHIETSAFSLLEDYDRVIQAMADEPYRAWLSRMINPNRVIPVHGPEDLTRAFQLHMDSPHIQKVFFSFNERPRR